VLVREEREPGSSGKAVVDARGRSLHGFDYGGVPSMAAKLTKWRPYRSQVEAGNVHVLNRAWTKAFIDEHEGADGRTTRDDQVDAACGGYLALVREAPVGLIQTAQIRVGG
jgi:predicted phage terminase large subunit-like protein